MANGTTTFGFGKAEGRDIDPRELSAATGEETDQETEAVDDGGSSGSGRSGGGGSSGGGGGGTTTFPRGPDPALAESMESQFTEEQFQEPATSLEAEGTALVTTESGAVGVQRDLAERVVRDVNTRVRERGDPSGTDGQEGTTGLDDSGDTRTTMDDGTGSPGTTTDPLIPTIQDLSGGGGAGRGGGGGIATGTLVVAGLAAGAAWLLAG